MEPLIAVIAVLILFVIVAAFNQPEQEPEPAEKPLYPALDWDSIRGMGTWPQVPTIITSPEYSRWFERTIQKHQPPYQETGMLSPSIRVISSPHLKRDEAYLIDRQELNKRISDIAREHTEKILWHGVRPESEARDE